MISPQRVVKGTREIWNFLKKLFLQKVPTQKFATPQLGGDLVANAKLKSENSAKLFIRSSLKYRLVRWYQRATANTAKVHSWGGDSEGGTSRRDGRIPMGYYQEGSRPRNYESWYPCRVWYAVFNVTLNFQPEHEPRPRKIVIVYCNEQLLSAET